MVFGRSDGKIAIIVEDLTRMERNRERVEKFGPLLTFFTWSASHTLTLGVTKTESKTMLRLGFGRGHLIIN